MERNHSKKRENNVRERRIKESCFEKLTSVKYGYEEYVGIDLESFGVDGGKFVVETFRKDMFLVIVTKLFDKTRKEPYYDVMTVLNPAENGLKSFKTFQYYPPFSIAQVPLYGRWIDDKDGRLMELLEVNKITRGLVDKVKVNFNIKEYVEYFV
jgi:hypothetical protein